MTSWLRGEIMHWKRREHVPTNQSKRRHTPTTWTVSHLICHQHRECKHHFSKQQIVKWCGCWFKYPLIEAIDHLVSLLDSIVTNSFDIFTMSEIGLILLSTTRAFIFQATLSIDKTAAHTNWAVDCVYIKENLKVSSKFIQHIVVLQALHLIFLMTLPKLLRSLSCQDLISLYWLSRKKICT